MAEYKVRWSRPGLDRVRVGKGRAKGFNPDGSLFIVDDDGKLRAIHVEHVQRQVKVGSRLKWRAWSDEDTIELRGTMVSDERRQDDQDADSREGQPPAAPRRTVGRGRRGRQGRGR